MCNSQCGLLLFLAFMCVMICMIYLCQRKCIDYELQKWQEDTYYSGQKSVDLESDLEIDEVNLKPDKDKCVPKVKYYDNVQEIIV